MLRLSSWYAYLLSCCTGVIDIAEPEWTNGDRPGGARLKAAARRERWAADLQFYDTPGTPARSHLRQPARQVLLRGEHRQPIHMGERLPCRMGPRHLAHVAPVEEELRRVRPRHRELQPQVADDARVVVVRASGEQLLLELG